MTEPTPTPSSTPSTPPDNADAPAPSADKPRKAGPSLAERARLAVAAEFRKDGADDKTKSMMAGLLLTRRVTRWVRRILVATVVLFIVYAAVRYQVVRLPKTYVSMLPSFAPDQGVVVDRFPARFPSLIEGFRPGDVILWVDVRNGVEYERLARIAAVAGSNVELDAGPNGRWHYRIDGELLRNPTPPVDAEGNPSSSGVGRVPPGHLMVLEDADDPAVSRDSRHFGFLPYANVRGRVVLSWANNVAPPAH
ncbi:MAG: signal peptidase I [Planctomycetota bacterium]